MTVKELFVKFGVEVDNNKVNAAKSRVNDVKQMATKALGAIGVGLSAKAIINQLKKIRTIADAVAEVKKRWATAGKELDRAIGFSDTIAAGIKNISNHLLTLFNRIKPKIVDISAKLGGISTVIKTVLASVTAIAATKAISSLVPSMARGKLALIAAAIMLIFLLVEDFVYFMQGKGSVLGDLCKKYGVNADELRIRIKQIFTKIKVFFIETWQKILAVLSPIWGLLKKRAEKIFEGLAKFWREHGEKIYKNLSDAWKKIVGAVEKAKQKLKPYIKEVKDIFDMLKENLSFGDVDAGDIIEDISSAVSTLAGYISKAVDALPDFATLESKFAAINGFLKENGTLIKAIATAVGVLVGAYVLWNAAMYLGQGIGELMLITMTKMNALSLKDTIIKGLQIVKQTILNAVMSANPIGLIILAIIALIAIVVLLIKNWDKIIAKAKNLASAVVEKFNEIKEKVSQKVESIKNKIKEKFDAVVTWFKNNWKQILLFILNPFAGAFTLVYNNSEKFRNYINNLLASIKEKFGEFKDKLKEKVSSWKDAIVEGFESVKTWFEELPGRALQWGKDMLENFIQGIKDKFPLLGDAIDWITGKIDDNLGHSVPREGPLKDDDKWMPDFMDNMVNGIRGKLPQLKGMIDLVAGNMTLLAQVQTVDGRTAAGAALSAVSKNVTQNVNISNTFNGSDRQQQVDGARAMDTAADDATSQMARAIRTAR